MHGAKKYTFCRDCEDVIMCAVNGNAYVYKISAHILTGRLSPLKPHKFSWQELEFHIHPKNEWDSEGSVCAYEGWNIKKKIKTTTTMEWVTRLLVSWLPWAWPQRDWGLWFPFEYDNYDISSNWYCLLSSGLCGEPHVWLGAFHLRRERESEGRSGEKGCEEREVVCCFEKLYHCGKCYFPLGMSHHNGENVSLSTSCVKRYQVALVSQGRVLVQNMCPFVVWLSQTWT